MYINWHVWNYDSSCTSTHTTLPVMVLENFMQLIFVIQLTYFGAIISSSTPLHFIKGSLNS